MTPVLPPDAALARLATLTPGLRAAALVGAGGRLLAGDAGLAAAVAAGGALPRGVVVVRGRGLTVAARVAAPVLPGLLRADLAAALASAGDDAAP